MSAALLEEIRAEAVARALAGRKLEEVRLHPDAFRGVARYLQAKIAAGAGTIGGTGASPAGFTMVLDIDGHGPVTVRSDATVPSDGHPRFMPEAVPGSPPLDDIRRKARAALGGHRWRVYRCRHASEFEACGIKAEPFVSEDVDATQRGVVYDTSYDECHHSMLLREAEHIAASDPAAVIALTDEIARLRAHVARLDVSDRALRTLRAWLAELNQDAQRWLDESDDRANLRAAANRIRLLCEAPIATTTTARGQGMTEIEEQASRLRAAKEAMSALDRIAAQVEGKNADRLRAAWRAMTNEERLELIQSACRSCGSLDTSCRCGDDS